MQFRTAEAGWLRQPTHCCLCCATLQLVLLSGLEHPNIVRYLGTSRDENSLYIFLEYVPVRKQLAHASWAHLTTQHTHWGGLFCCC